MQKMVLSRYLYPSGLPPVPGCPVLLRFGTPDSWDIFSTNNVPKVFPSMCCNESIVSEQFFFTPLTLVPFDRSCFFRSLSSPFLRTPLCPPHDPPCSRRPTLSHLTKPYLRRPGTRWFPPVLEGLVEDENSLSPFLEGGTALLRRHGGAFSSLIFFF